MRRRTDGYPFRWSLVSPLARVPRRGATRGDGAGRSAGRTRWNRPRESSWGGSRRALNTAAPVDRTRSLPGVDLIELLRADVGNEPVGARPRDRVLRQLRRVGVVQREDHEPLAPPPGERPEHG